MELEELPKKEFTMIYKQLSEEMRDGLKNIYQQITSASAESKGKAQDPGALFTEASTQLDEVVKATESAAMNIMEIVEKQFTAAGESAQLLETLQVELPDNEAIKKLKAINKKLIADLTEVLTALSFQDITGQRIKKVMHALKAIERSVLDLYLSSGLMMNAAEANPNGDAEQIQADAHKALEDFHESRSELKGPDQNAPSQGEIDAMLAQLGL